MSIVHVFSFGNIILHITSIFNALELINNIQIMYIASAKIPEGSISPFSFYGQPPDNQSHVFSLASPVDEVSFKEMRTWDRFKITSYCICDWFESGELGGRRSLKFPCVTPVVETSKTELPNMYDGAPLRKQPTAQTR